MLRKRDAKNAENLDKKVIGKKKIRNCTSIIITGDISIYHNIHNLQLFRYLIANTIKKINE